MLWNRFHEEHNHLNDTSIIFFIKPEIYSNNIDVTITYVISLPSRSRVCKARTDREYGSLLDCEWSPVTRRSWGHTIAGAGSVSRNRPLRACPICVSHLLVSFAGPSACPNIIIIYCATLPFVCAND